MDEDIYKYLHIWFVCIFRNNGNIYEEIMNERAYSFYCNSQQETFRNLHYDGNRK